MPDDSVFLTLLAAAEIPVDLEPLASRIRASSNFCFDWQWYRRAPRRPPSGEEAMRLLAAVCRDGELHGFLHRSRDPDDEASFEIELPHSHSRFLPADGGLEQVLARAAADHLGAYSRFLENAAPAQVQEVRDLFLAAGSYRPFELNRGAIPGCRECRQWGSHLFSSWFYGVAWDWCFCVLWEESDLVWLGCLTDTD